MYSTTPLLSNTARNADMDLLDKEAVYQLESAMCRRKPLAPACAQQEKFSKRHPNAAARAVSTLMRIMGAVLDLRD